MEKAPRSEEVEFLIRVCKEAADKITSNFTVSAKDDCGDLVTNLDIEIEEFIIGEIKKNYPVFGIISEEFNASAKATQNYFTIDPIDGTVNFANGLPLWGIQIACIKDGETVAAVINLPKFDELYYADKNGAFIESAQGIQKISVSNLAPERGLYISNDISPDFELQRRYRRIYSVAVECAWIAAGRINGKVIKKHTEAEYIARAWDYMPGVYLIKQAGGEVYSDGNGLTIVANTKETLEFLLKRHIECQGGTK